MKTWMLFASVVCGVLLVAHGAVGGDGCGADRCDSCGCACDSCDKVCKLVADKKKITKIHYACECEDFCVPGRSCEGCEVCASADAPPPPKDDECCAHTPNTWIKWKEWCPTGCGEARCRKKLVKYEVSVEVPSYKWVVEKCCPACACGAKAAE